MKRILISLLLVISLAFGGFYIYVSDYYRADIESVEAFMPGSDVEERELGDGSLAYIPAEYKVGVVFYPGGKVDYAAYEPLMRALAERGVLAVLVKMPCNLAVLKPGAADGITDQLPAVEKWYMAGHSLGGSMAASYVSKHADRFEGLIMLAAYSTADLKPSGVRVVSIYGSCDGVMSREKYSKYKENLPSDFSEVIIEGGNHAFFGMYGHQKNDGEATVTNAEQIEFTADVIAKFVN